AQDLSAEVFESSAKGKSLIRLVSRYEDELTTLRLVDTASASKMAADALRKDSVFLPPDLLITIPEDIEKGLSGLERAMWESLPRDAKHILPTDQPCTNTGGSMNDASLLAWLSRPSDAPAPFFDGTCEIYRAAGESNEVREMLRRILEAGIPFDDVEILYSDSSTYPYLIYEICSKLSDAVPVTFSEGVPLRYSRPARALAGWLSFIRGSFKQSDLACLIQEGLLDMGEPAPTFSFSSLANELRSLPIRFSKDRYLPAIDFALSHSENAQRVELLSALKSLVEDVLAWAPENGKGLRTNLEGARLFLERRARCVNELDEYARRRMLDGVEELARCLSLDQPAFNIEDWLGELIRFGRVEGEGPRPGCLYASPLHSGGHSGRSHIFMLGLDEGRFPGAGLQDPLLLDGERGRISGDLSTAGARLSESLEEFSRLAARIRGKITLSYNSRDIEDDREIFPSQAILSAFRILSGKKDGLLTDFLAWIPEPCSFAPSDPQRSLDTAEWWLAHLSRGSLEGRQPLLATAFPHLGRGFQAQAARASDLFTVYDGWVPEAGRDLDPGRPGGTILSASRLEKLGKCPFEYFLEYVLEVKPPEDNSPDHSLWLAAKERGDLLHAVFRKFHHLMCREYLRPQFERDRGLLENILETEVLAWKNTKPPPNREVFEAEMDELRNTVSIFLYEEERSCRQREPLYFEAAIGLRPKGEGNSIDCEEPLLVSLPDGSTIRVRGYIDRIDIAGGEYILCDYKTGSSKRFGGEDPFQAGRRVQGGLYIALAESRLAESSRRARIGSFEYFFLNTREHGRRMAWSSDELRQGLSTIAKLCEVLRQGCFTLSDDENDFKNSDYRMAFGDIQATCQSAKKKLTRAENRNIAPFAVLRGYREEQT
ncbi:MAG: hypothetical protein A2Y75_11685, partial [Candidatus Solincola sediminis]